jgi:hypothetical protein
VSYYPWIAVPRSQALTHIGFGNTNLFDVRLLLNHGYLHTLTFADKPLGTSYHAIYDTVAVYKHGIDLVRTLCSTVAKRFGV